jgi:AcrR family transcriptional regulator
MAKSGVASRPRNASPARADTRQALIDAAVETLKSHGYAGTSARAIGKQAGCNQALVFYHFGSVVELLLAALDDVSARRMKRYMAALAQVSNPADLVGVAAAVFREDMDNGDVTVLVEMIAGASATPGLGAEVASRIAPWRDFAHRAMASGLSGSPLGSLVPLGELSYAVVALYLGLEMLSHLDGDRGPATALFDHAGQLPALLAALSDASPAAPPTKEKR